mmetsp:Transcript_3847/g.9078  ORF Transcript_3847/g.9078 Transcript_3847/m.9078 type:complete len:179 (+) Transcript_3847:3-539(+)
MEPRPFAWPSPSPVSLSVDLAHTSLRIPGLPPSYLSAVSGSDVHPLPPSTVPQGIPLSVVRPGTSHRRVTVDAERGQFVLSVRDDSGGFEVEGHGLTLDEHGEDVFTIDEGDPMSARVVCTRFVSLGEPSLPKTTVATESVMTCSDTKFFVKDHVRVGCDGVEMWSRVDEYEVPRDLM